MKIQLKMLLLPIALLSANCFSHENSDPLLTHLMLNQLEVSEHNGSALEAQAWVGKDFHKLWLKTDVERRDSNTEDAEIQVLYSRALNPFWDLQMGARHDLKPTPDRTWGVLGVRGLAPYFFDLDAALFVSDSGHTAARFSVDYELLLTQRLILTPTIEINFYGQNDTETATGSGLSDAKTGLRLRYEIQREFAPYVGIQWQKKFGNTADFDKGTGDVVSDMELVVGLHAWF
ncbi:MAG: copper resistance protein B [Pseudomonadota bacterium]